MRKCFTQSSLMTHTVHKACTGVFLYVPSFDHMLSHVPTHQNWTRAALVRGQSMNLSTSWAAQSKLVRKAISTALCMIIHEIQRQFTFYEMQKIRQLCLISGWNYFLFNQTAIFFLKLSTDLFWLISNTQCT